MPFKEYPQPNVHVWLPPHRGFSQADDRLLVETTWNDYVLLSWSSDDRFTGRLIVAPEAVPVNVALFLRGMLEAYEHAIGVTIQPTLDVTQTDDNRLEFALNHPRYQGRFYSEGTVDHVRAIKRGRKPPPTTFAGRRPVVSERTSNS